MKTFLPSILRKRIFLSFAFLIFSFCLKAQTETLSTGSFIINMGATNPNTIANGLKPYGLVYDLIRNYSVPIKWVISQTKLKDGVDFTYNGVQYKGGTFVIPFEFRSAAVNARITYWTGLGVVGNTTTSPLTVNVTYTLVSYPRWTLDATNGALAQTYLTNAGVTLAAFPGAYNWKTPATLTCCDDYYVMPHADPTWATHGNLWSWNKNCLGTIWAGCHAVSVLESLVNPLNATQKMNFLSTTGLLLYSLHSGGSIPYTHQLPNDPVAQYLGATDLAQLNGSEQIYMPNPGGAWLPTTNIIAYDPTQANVPANSPGPATLIAYGRGMGDPTRGYVMYEASHSLNKGTVDDVAAQRAFWNFSLFQVTIKTPHLTVTGISSGQNINAGSTIAGLNVVATSPLTGVSFTYQWSSSCGGTFSNATGATTNFIAPASSSTLNCVINCTVTDNCGRVAFQSFPIVVLGNAPPTAVNDVQTINPGCTAVSLTYNVLANDADAAGRPLTLTNVTGAANGTVSFTGSGNVTYTPNPGFVGIETLTYTVCDNTTPVPLCSTATYTITVGNVANVPNAVNDAFTIGENTIGSFNVLANDLPVVSGSLTVSAITSGPANGVVSINIDNTITYLPNLNFVGIDNFTYRIVNSLGYTKTATVTVTVTSSGCGNGMYQTAAAGSGSYSQNSSQDNFLDQKNATKNNGINNTISVDGQSGGNLLRGLLQFNVSSVPSNATIANATLTMYVAGGSAGGAAPAANISLYRVTSAWDEGTGNNQPGISNWTQRAAGPLTWTTAGGDFNATAETNTTIPANPGPNGTAYTWTGGTMNTLIQNWVNSTYPNNGMILKFTTEGTVNDNKNFASNNNPTVADRPLLTFNWTTPVTCATVPTRAPMAMPDTATTVNGIAVNIATATNDYYPVAGAKTYSIVTAPSSGTAAINAGTGIITYTPAGTFNGVMSMTYRVLDNTSGLADTANVYVNITDSPIQAVSDAPVGANSGLTQTINVKANDIDLENQVAASTVTIATPPNNGSATVNGSGSVLYTPNPGFTGNDTLYYSICEPAPACGSGFCSIARVIVTVLNQAPTAVADSKTILPCAPSTINIVANDTDPEGGVLTVGSISALSPLASGSLANNNDGTVTFTPATGFTGVATFTYKVTDNGVPTLTSAPATVTITVTNPAVLAPVAVNDADTTTMDQQLVASVTDNDYDPNNNPLTIPSITVAPVHGTATVNAINGLITYIPSPGFFGTDVLTYQVCNIVTSNVATCSSGVGLCSTATLTITVTAPNTVVAANDENNTWINTPVFGGVMANDFSPSANYPLSFDGYTIGGVSLTSGSATVSGVDLTNTSVANAGTLSINTNGTYTFTPATGFTGFINVPYTIHDANSNPAYDSAYLHITVSPLPSTNSVIANHDVNISYGATVSNNVLVNDADPKGNTLGITGYIYDPNGSGIPSATGTLGSPITIGGITTSGLPTSNAGSLTLNANGSYSFTPALDFHGKTDATYTVCDNGSPIACATAILHITVLPNTNPSANHAPFAGEDFAVTSFNTPVNGNFIANDADPDGNSVSLSGTTIVPGGGATPIGATVTTTGGGAVQFYANGTHKYTPLTGFSGPDQLPYTISDVTAVAPQPLSAIATLHFLVAPSISTLGIKNIQLTAQLAQKQALLNWAVTGEADVQDYVVERSIDGTNFTAIATVAARNNNQEQNSYSATDDVSALSASIIYYRISQYNMDGHSLLSNVATLSLVNDEIVNAWPTLFNDHVFISYYSLSMNKIHFQLTDNLGRMIRSGDQLLATGNNEFELQALGQLSPGTYFLRLLNPAQSKTYVWKLIKGNN